MREGSPVAKGIMIVESEPSDPSREAEYNEWYREVHAPELCALPGFVGVRRYKLRDGAGSPPADEGRRRYVAIYELQADDLAEPLGALKARAAARTAPVSDVLQLSPPPVVTVYEWIE
jgi:hypothetical protein